MEIEKAMTCYNEQNKVTTSIQLASNMVTKKYGTLTNMFGKGHVVVNFLAIIPNFSIL
jgi:hypothetical protein